MSLGGGDQLARGLPRANFSQGMDITEERWKAIFGEEGLRKLNAMSEKEQEELRKEALAEVEKQEKENEVKLPVTKFHTIRDRVIVTRFEEAEKVGDLYVPDEGKEKPAKGIVVAVGPGVYVNGELQKMSVKEGDKVAFGKFSGAEIQIGFGHYLVLREEDIFIIED
jgi:chaperonin GroES